MDNVRFMYCRNCDNSIQFIHVHILAYQMHHTAGTVNLFVTDLNDFVCYRFAGQIVTNNALWIML